MSDKVIYVMYDDDGVLKDGAKKLVSKGVKFPIRFLLSQFTELILLLV